MAAANLIQADKDEGPGLMMTCVKDVHKRAMPLDARAPAMASMQLDPPMHTGDAHTTTLATVGLPTHMGDHIFLNEERDVIMPMHDGHRRGKIWFLDTGATNHMTGLVDAFTELDRSITGMVLFADDSVIKIHGCGTIVFVIDVGDHMAFMDVYFIQSLKSSFVSPDQLNENRYDIAIRHGVVTVRDQRSHLLIKITHGPNRLYKLSFRPVHPECLPVGHVSNA